MILYLIRHGKTAANEAHLYCGSTDLPLSEAGLEELRGLSYSLPPDPRFYTSGMLRTEQTLTALFGPVAHTAVPELREMDFGVFEMRSYEMLREDPAYLAWISGDNEKNTAPGGESGVQMTRRAWAAYQEIAERGQNSVLVTHGGVIAAIMAELFPAEGKNRYQWQSAPGHGYRIENGSWRPLP